MLLEQLLVEFLVNITVELPQPGSAPLFAHGKGGTHTLLNQLPCEGVLLLIRHTDKDGAETCPEMG